MSQSEDMPEEITYSRTGTIAAVSDYYKFLTTMYMDDSQVVYPPAGGWPSIVNADPNVLKLLGKSDEVLLLLAHLPRIRGPGNYTSDADAAPMCLFADWPDLIGLLTHDPTYLDFVRVRTEGDFGRLANPHTIGLASGPYDNPVIVLDTKLGIIYWEECPDEVEMAYGKCMVPHNENASVDEEEDEDNDSVDEEEDEDNDSVDEEENDDNVDEKYLDWEWRDGAAAWAIPKFFEILKDRFIGLHWIPISPRSVRGPPGTLGLNQEDIMAMLPGIYRQHGWPDLAVYDKSACLEAVDRALAESYPGVNCVRRRGRLTPDPSIFGAEPTPAASW